MWSNFAELTVRRLKAGDPSLFRIWIIADQRTSVTVEIFKVENVLLSGGGPINNEPRKIAETNFIVENCNKDKHLEDIMAEK